MTEKLLSSELSLKEEMKIYKSKDIKDVIEIEKRNLDTDGFNNKSAYTLAIMQACLPYAEKIEQLEEDIKICKINLRDTECYNDYLKAELEAEKEKNRWISVEDRLPEENLDVFVSSGDTKRIMTDYLLNGKFKCYGESVKYWMVQNITPPESE